MYMREAAKRSYDDKLDRMGVRVSTASTGAKGVGDAYPQDDGTQGEAQGDRAAGYATEEENERTLEGKAPKKLRLDRKPFKNGGAVKKGTTVNVIVAPQNKEQMPPPPPMMPPPGGPPPMPGPGAGPLPSAGGPPMGGPPAMMRKDGGRVPHMTAGALSGEGRLQKIDQYGSNARPGRKDGGAVNGNWIKGAIKHPGALRKTAKREGLVHGDEKLSENDLDKLSHSDNPKTRQRAGLAKTLKKMG